MYSKALQMTMVLSQNCWHQDFAMVHPDVSAPPKGSHWFSSFFFVRQLALQKKHIGQIDTQGNHPGSLVRRH